MDQFIWSWGFDSVSIKQSGMRRGNEIKKKKENRDGGTVSLM